MNRRLVFNRLEEVNAGEDPVFTGAWCFDDFDLEKFQDFKYIWSDRKRLRKSHVLIFECYEKVLVQLSSELNTLHEVNFPVKSWRILIGPWLYHFLAILFERSSVLLSSFDTSEVFYCKIPNFDSNQFVPLDYSEFNQFFESDEWNYFICSLVIKRISPQSVVETSETFERFPKPNLSVNASLRYRLGTLLLRQLTKARGVFSKKLILVECGLSVAETLRILLRLRCYPFSFYFRQRIYRKHVDVEKRKRIGLQIDDEWLKPFGKILIDQIPISYVEGFGSLESLSDSFFPQHCSAVLTATGYFSNEPFKFWMAKQHATSSLQIGVSVHGAHHGTALFNGPGDLTETIADRFFSWGWSNPWLPSVKLSRVLSERTKNRPSADSDSVLYAFYDASVYSSYVDAAPISGDLVNYYSKGLTFLKCISDKGYASYFTIRSKRSSLAWHLEKVIAEIGPFQFSSNQNESFKDAMKESGLVIASYDSTIALEAIAANYPCVLFIDESHWELSEKAKPIFAKLERCGVLIKDPEVLAEFVVQYFGSYRIWWESDEVQSAIRAYVDQFARPSLDWQSVWVSELQKLVGKE
ncbi:MAG: LIC12162 family transferase [Candidatus Puniceispirillaceae bacterium]